MTASPTAAPDHRVAPSGGAATGGGAPRAHREPPLLLFVATEDWYFVSHRLPLALAAQQAGYRVMLASRVGEHGALLERHGIRVVPLRLRRQGGGVAGELAAIRELRRVYRALRPAIVHHVALKPVVYGAVAAFGLRGVRRVHAVAGLGWLFASRQLAARALRPVVTLGLRALLPHGGAHVIVQNPDDRAEVVALGVPPSRVALVPGVGVNLVTFAPAPEPVGDPLVVLPARMLGDKGVREFVAAAVALRARGLRARFALVGPTDVNPAAISEAELRAWAASGACEWWGRRDDMPAVLAASAVVCLPSYREGMPKALLEAAAAGRPMVTCDVPGCREVVRHGVDGLLVPARDADALAEALGTLLTDPARRRRMGAAARARAEAEFGDRAATAQTLEVYARCRA